MKENEIKKLMLKFAAAALTGICANPEIPKSDTPTDLAEKAWAIADAMIDRMPCL